MGEVYCSFLDPINSLAARACHRHCMNCAVCWGQSSYEKLRCVCTGVLEDQVPEGATCQCLRLPMPTGLCRSTRT